MKLQFHPIAHFKTITKHRHQVMLHCFRAGIPIQGLLHDLSKYTPTEFIPGALFYQGTRSPNEAEREKNGYSAAWLHHKGRNKHHYEFWNDVNPASKRYEPVEMPTRYLIEMFCDRVAASKIYNGEKYTDADALNYFLSGMKRKIPMHPKTAKKLWFLLKMLADKGEAETFAYLRSMKK
ncbi:MAG: catalase [Oscillospiraceae bacterium]|nr:catalase [Oscillospiraceae bacterium]